MPVEAPELEFQLLVSLPPFLITPGFVERVRLIGDGSGRAAGQHRKGGAEQGHQAAAGMVFTFVFQDFTVGRSQINCDRPRYPALEQP